jgi:hypothetical protein
VVLVTVAAAQAILGQEILVDQAAVLSKSTQQRLAHLDKEMRAAVRLKEQMAAAAVVVKEVQVLQQLAQSVQLAALE